MSTDTTSLSAGAPADERTWATHLALLEVAVAEAHAAVQDACDEDVVLDERVFTTTAPVGPLMPADVERVRSVLGDLHDLVAALEAARSRVARELGLHRRLAAGRQDGPSPRYLDDRC